MSIVLSVAAAAIDSNKTRGHGHKKSNPPRRARAVGFAVGDVPKVTNLQVGIAPNMFGVVDGFVDQG